MIPMPHFAKRSLSFASLCLVIGIAGESFGAPPLDNGNSGGAQDLFNFGGLTYSYNGTINNQNGSLFWNFGAGSTVDNTAGNVINNINDYFDTGGVLQANNSGQASNISNFSGAIVNNGDATGASIIINGGYLNAPTWLPGETVTVLGGSLFLNEGSINNQNGSHLDNFGSGSVLTNTDGGVLNNFSGYLDSLGDFQSNTSGATSTIKNGFGSVLNRGFSPAPFVPGANVTYTNDGALLDNSGATINNQNGSHLDNFGTGAVLTNTGGGVINNFSGYLDTNGVYQSNTTGATSTIRNSFGSVLNNGDASGYALIMNGGYSNGLFVPGGLVTYTNDGALLYNTDATINNQNGSHLDSYGTGAVLTNTAGGVIK